MEPFLGQIMMFGGNFAPRGWAKCDGQLLAISSNTALFSLLGTTYGGDGRTTFALPDLRGRVSMNAGNGPGLSSRQLGQRIGAETNTMTTQQLPNHSHTATVGGSVSLQVSTDDGEDSSPNNQYLAALPTGTTNIYIDSPTAGANLGGVVNDLSVTVAGSGGNQAMDNMQPSLALTFVIATQGLYPSRN